MRKTFLAAGATALLCAVPFHSFAAEEPPKITVQGEAEIRVTPDEVALTFGVETFHEDLEAAKTDNDAVMARLLEAAADQGVAKKDIATDYLSLEPRIRNDNGFHQLMGYQVRRTVVITLKETKKFEDLLAAALKAGVNFVHGVDFRTTELRRHRDRARDLAVVAAREKAEAMAGSLDRSIGKPLTISEGYMGWWSPYAYWGGRHRGSFSQNVMISAPDAGSSWEGPTPPGQIAVTARVSVTFELVD